MDVRRFVALAVGTALVSLGGGIAALGMVDDAYLPTLAGFTLTVIGYRTAQWTEMSAPLPRFSTDSRRVLLRDLVQIVGGGALFSYGFVMGAGAGAQPVLTDVGMARILLSGVVIVLGFFLMHTGLNDVIL